MERNKDKQKSLYYNIYTIAFVQVSSVPNKSKSAQIYFTPPSIYRCPSHAAPR